MHLRLEVMPEHARQDERLYVKHDTTLCVC